MIKRFSRSLRGATPSDRHDPAGRLIGFFPAGQATTVRRPSPVRQRLGMGLGLGLALLATGCQGPLTPPENLQVVIATGEGSDAVVRTSLQKLASQMVGEFMRNHPGTNLHQIGRAHV